MKELAGRMRRRLRLGPGTLALLAGLAFLLIVLQSGKWSNGVVAVSEAALMATPGAYELRAARTAMPVHGGAVAAVMDVHMDRKHVEGSKDQRNMPTATPTSTFGPVFHSHRHGAGVIVDHGTPGNHHNTGHNKYFDEPDDYGLCVKEVVDSDVVISGGSCDITNPATPVRDDRQRYFSFGLSCGRQCGTEWEDNDLWSEIEWPIEIDHYHFHDVGIVDDDIMSLLGWDGSDVEVIEGQRFAYIYPIDGGNAPYRLEITERTYGGNTESGGLNLNLTHLNGFVWHNRFRHRRYGAGVSACRIASGYDLPCSSPMAEARGYPHALTIRYGTSGLLPTGGYVKGIIYDNDGASVSFTVNIRLIRLNVADLTATPTVAPAEKEIDISLDPDVPNAGERVYITVESVRNIDGKNRQNLGDMTKCQVVELDDIRVRGVLRGRGGYTFSSSNTDTINVAVARGLGNEDDIVDIVASGCPAAMSRSSSGWLAVRAAYTTADIWSHWAWKWFVTPDVSFDVSGLQFEDFGERNEGFALELDVGDLWSDERERITEAEISGACAGGTIAGCNWWQEAEKAVAWNVYRNGDNAYMVKNDCHASHLTRNVQINALSDRATLHANGSGAFKFDSDGRLLARAGTYWQHTDGRAPRAWRHERPGGAGSLGLCIVEIPLIATVDKFGINQIAGVGVEGGDDNPSVNWFGWQEPLLCRSGCP